MTRLIAAWSRLIDEQHRLPQGLLGELIGRRMARQHQPETDWTLRLLDLQPQDRVLELGFGAGRAVAQAVPRVTSGLVVGLDRSTTMLRSTARRQRAARQAGTLALLGGDLTAVPIAEAMIDKIWSIHTYYFWPEPLVQMRDLVHLLRPGGRLVVTLATGTLHPSGPLEYWPLHAQVETLVQALDRQGVAARLLDGPYSRQYNNVAMVIQR